MIVKLNENPHEVAEGTTLDKIIESLEIQLQGVAVAVDYEVIPKSKWNETTLENGMAIMIIQAVSGG